MQRRFNHFVWLYEQLSNAYPGVIVPPIPEKQAIGMPAPCLVLPSRCALLADRPPGRRRPARPGRFDPEFLTSRKNALEKCLRRIVSHPVLYQSTDLKLFLEEDNLDAAVRTA